MGGISTGVRRIAKRYIPLAWREWMGTQRWEVGLQRRAIRAGVSPASVLRKKLLGQDDGLTFKGVRVRTNDAGSTQSVAREIWCHGEYDVPGYVAQPGWRVVDIGGNVGLYAMHAASRGAQVVSYEPHPESAECFRANTAKWNVELRQAAVVAHGGRPMTLYTDPHRAIRNSLVAKDVRTGEVLTTGIEVPTVALSEALAEPCDLLKVDCEGGEFDLFLHAGDALRNTRRIIAEVHLNAGDPQAALAAVEAAGFDAELRPSRRPDLPYAQLTATRRGDGPTSARN